MIVVVGFIFTFGLVIGSFLNVCIYRLPLHQSIVTPPSHCFHCQTRLKPWDLVPIFSYLQLRGRCRYCGATVSPRYALIELLTGLVFVWAYIVLGLAPQLAGALLLSSFLIVITFVDYDHQLILDKVLVWMAGAGVAINLSAGQTSVLDILAGAALGGGVLLIIAVVSRGGMGGGDVKFLAVLGLWLGLKLTSLTLFLAFMLGGIGGTLLLLLKLKGRKDRIPFGPYIAVAAWLALLYGEQILAWYWRQL
mgnify:CR=1 FL=1